MDSAEVDSELTFQFIVQFLSLAYVDDVKHQYQYLTDGDNNLYDNMHVNLK